MNDKFDELATGRAESVTRRGALMKKLGLSLALTALTVAPAARADMVTDWNATAEQAVKTAALNPGVQGRFLAIVQTAVCNSCNVGEAVGLQIADYVLDHFLLRLDDENEQ